MIIKANNLMTLTNFDIPDKANLESENIFKKLSTGKIASLFTIEEPQTLNQAMKCRMRVLDQGARYAQEGVSIVQAAQEGLEKSKATLLEMKKLVSMAAEDIYTDADRQMIQREIDGLNKQLDHIAYSTNYKGYNLLATNDAVAKEETALVVEDLAAGGDAALLVDGLTIAEDTAHTLNLPDESEKITFKEQVPPLPPAKDPAMEEFMKRIERSSVTAVDLGTDKVDVSSAELAAQSMEIVENAIRKVEDELIKYRIYEIEFGSQFRVEDIEDEPSLKTKPSMIIDAMELTKYNLLNSETQILMDNLVQDPENVMNLLK